MAGGGMGQRSSGTVGRNNVYYEPLPDRPESIGKAAAAWLIGELVILLLLMLLYVHFQSSGAV